MSIILPIISFEEENKLKLEKVEKNIKNILVIGLGASIINCRAILPCVTLSKNIIFLDSIEEKIITKKIEALNSNNTIIVAISKSGTTSETILLLKYVLTSKLKNALTYLVSENEDSLLVKLGFEFSNYAKFYPYEKNISGRFSIILNSSLLPLHLAGCDINPIIEQARSYDNYIEAQRLAEILIKHYKNKRNILVLSVYDSNLTGVAEWIRQIVAESLGKNSFGLTSLISRGTIDEHSQLQLYLDGPDDKIYYLLPYHLKISQTSELDTSLLKHMHGFNNSIIDAGRPWILEEKFDINTICKWLVAVQYIAISQNINPFTQPAVDKAKRLFI